MFQQWPAGTPWRQVQKLYAPFPVQGDLYGFSVAMNQFFICVGVPFRTPTATKSGAVSPVLVAPPPCRRNTNIVTLQGAIEVYQRGYLYPKTDNFTHIWLTTLYSATSQTSERLGTVLSLSSTYLAAGGPNRFTDTQSDAVGPYRVYLYELL